jgi:hypothetical protein
MPLDTSTSTAFIKERFDKTMSAQTSLSTTFGWVYPVIPLDQWQAAQLELDAARDGTDPETTPSLAYRATQTAAARTARGGVLDRRYALIHSRTVQAVGVMRSRALGNADLRPVVDELSSRGGTPRIIEDEGAELLAGWKLEFAGDAFVPATGNTYSGLRELYEGKLAADKSVITPSLRQLKSEYKDAIAADRSAQGKLNGLLSRLEDQCIAWYSEASAVFAAGTIAGDMIRGTVPSSDQYAPGHPHPAPPTPGTGTTPPSTSPPKA